MAQKRNNLRLAKTVAQKMHLKVARAYIRMGKADLAQREVIEGLGYKGKKAYQEDLQEPVPREAENPLPSKRKRWRLPCLCCGKEMTEITDRIAWRVSHLLFLNSFLGRWFRLRLAGDGLSALTISNYTRAGRSTLERGVDFCVTRPTPWRRKTMITDRGLARLATRDYRVSYRGPERREVRVESFIPARALETYGNHERRMRLKDRAWRASQAYLDNPCEVPCCPCAIHRLHGLPQGEYIREVLRPKPSAYPHGGIPMFRKPKA